MADDSPQHAEAPTSTDAPTLTHRDIEILIAGFRSFKSAPEIDNAQLTAALGLSNPRSTTNAWRNLTKKLQGDQMPVLASGSKDGPKARGSAKSRATKTPKLVMTDDKTENEVKQPATMSTAPSFDTSENIVTAAPAAKANNTGVPTHSADIATPTDIGSNFQSKCKEAASALIPATPDLTGGDGSAVDTPTKSEPATPTPVPSAPAPPAGKTCGSEDTDPAIPVVEEEAKPTKNPRKAPVKKAKGKQANSETGTPDAAEADKSAPKKRKAPAKKAAKENGSVDGAEDAGTHEEDEPKPKSQRKAPAKKSADSKQPKKAAAGKNNSKEAEAEAALFAAEKAEADARKEHIKKVVEEANAVLMRETPATFITGRVDEDISNVEQFTSSGTTTTTTTATTTTYVANTDDDANDADDAEATDHLNGAIAAAFDDTIDSLLDLNTATVNTGEAKPTAANENE